MPRPVTQWMRAAAFGELADELRRSGSPERNPPDAVVAAGVLIRDGIVVSAGDSPARPARTGSAPAQPGIPSPYHLEQWHDADGDWRAVNDRVEFDIHGATSATHIDSLQHFFWRGRDFWGAAPGDLERDGLAADPMDELSKGIVGRGVLLDVPGALGHAIEPGSVVTLDDIRLTLEAQHVVPAPGDLLYISFGRENERRSDVALGSEPVPGLAIECARWLAGWSPAVVVTDQGLDPIPSEVEGVFTPWHVILLTSLGIPLVDSAKLVALAATCARRNRWEFFSTIAPLHIPHASGSPVNPLAIF